MATNVTGIYLQVVHDVINNVRADFQSESVDEGVLMELQSLWELKMMQSGAILNTGSTAFGRGGTTSVPSVHDLNVPYEATEEYMTPTADLLFPPTPHSNIVEPVMYQYFPPAPSEHASMLEPGIHEDVKIGRPSFYMQQPAPWMNQKPLGVDVNVAYEERREDEERHVSQPPITKEFFALSTSKRKREDFPPNYFSGSYIPQQDGTDDSDISLTSNLNASMCQDGAGDDYNEPGMDDAHHVYEEGLKGPKPEGAESDGSEPPLNEDDDDNLDDLDQGDEDPKTDHLVVAQFEKVTRSKNKWKCMLKEGVMHLNKRDYLFSKANGEFEF